MHNRSITRSLMTLAAVVLVALATRQALAGCGTWVYSNSCNTTSTPPCTNTTTCTSLWYSGYSSNPCDGVPGGYTEAFYKTTSAGVAAWYWCSDAYRYGGHSCTIYTKLCMTIDKFIGPDCLDSQKCASYTYSNCGADADTSGIACI